jgi:hypothetical protein
VRRVHHGHRGLQKPGAEAVDEPAPSVRVAVAEPDGPHVDAGEVAELDVLVAVDVVVAVGRNGERPPRASTTRTRCEEPS